ncbi:rhodanese domain-containing protein CG4456-like [Bradysia coprophila]|uniref:rhodanese domain-containing protein CG4456-like n=1 Tax=Bradysia coprophila TaxID=38358 RepID=UPI00187DBC98|nr:rhodanese domain-containing protein CG4456-like [Bradysia coprophila]
MLSIFNIQRLRCITKVNIPRAQCLAAIHQQKEIHFDRASKLHKPTVFRTEMSMSYSTTPPIVPVAYYEEIKDLPNHRERLLVDVREPSEIQKTGRIPTSINVPLDSVQKAFSNETSAEEFAKSFNHSKPNIKDQIIFSCLSGKRSQMAAETVMTLGYKQIKNYKGSWTEWAEKNGLPVK